MAAVKIQAGSGGEVHEIPKALAIKSNCIKALIEDVDGDDDVLLIDCTSECLEKIIEFLKHPRPEETDDEFRKRPLNEWEKKFMQVSMSLHFELIKKSNFLDIKGLLKLCCKTIAEMIKVKSVEECKSILGKGSNFTDEQKAETLASHPCLSE